MRVPALFLTALGFVAIGLSGVVDRILLIVFGADFVFGDPPGTAYPASDCHYWTSIHPHTARTFTTTVAVSVFGTAGVLLTGYGVDRAVLYGAHGPGQWLSAGAVALVVALTSGVILLRSWRTEVAS